MVDEAAIAQRWAEMQGSLTERQRRLWAAAEARSHGRGGLAAVVRATGMAETTVRRGRADLDAGEQWDVGRVRRPGAGRPLLKGIKVSTVQMDAINLARHEFHGDWNYTITPSPTADTRALITS